MSKIITTRKEQQIEKKLSASAPQFVGIKKIKASDHGLCNISTKISHLSDMQATIKNVQGSKKSKTRGAMVYKICDQFVDSTISTSIDPISKKVIEMGYEEKDVRMVKFQLEAQPNRNGAPVTVHEILAIFQDRVKKKKTLVADNGKDEKYGNCITKKDPNSGSMQVYAFDIEAEARRWNPLTKEGIKTIIKWNTMLAESQNGSVIEKSNFDVVFRKSCALEIIVKKLLQYFFHTEEKVRGSLIRHSILQLFGLCLIGTSEYHQWLLKKIDELAKRMDKISENDGFIQYITKVFTNQKHMTQPVREITSILQVDNRPYPTKPIRFADIGLSKKYFDVPNPILKFNNTLMHTSEFNNTLMHASWKNAMKSAHQINFLEGKLNKYFSFLGENKPLDKMQLEFRYLGNEIQKVLKDNSTLFTKKMEKLSKTNTNITQSANIYEIQKQKLGQRKIALEAELARIELDLQALQTRKKGEIQPLSVSNPFYTKKLAVLNTKSAELTSERINNQQLCTSTGQVVGVYESLHNHLTGDIQKLKRVSHTMCQSWLKHLEKHIILCNNVADLLWNRLFFYKEELKKISKKQSKTQALGLSLSSIEKSRFKKIDEDQKIDDKRMKHLKNHVQELFRRLEKLSKIIPPTEEIVFCYKEFLRCLQLRQVTFNLGKIKSIIAFADGQLPQFSKHPPQQSQPYKQWNTRPHAQLQQI